MPEIRLIVVMLYFRFEPIFAVASKVVKSDLKIITSLVLESDIMFANVGFDST
jgi:hypothetical protein